MICEDVLNERLTFRHVTDQANYIKTKYDKGIIRLISQFEMI